MIELAFGGLVAVGLPIRAWLRRTRPAPRSFNRYLVETLALTVALSALLWRNGVPARSLGLVVDSYWRFVLGVVICFVVVVGPDAWAAWRITATAQPGDPLPEPDPLFADVTAGHHATGTFVAAMIVGAIWEELCFRATVLALVPQTSAGMLVGVAGGSLAFGAQHLRLGIRRSAISSGFGVMFAVLYLATHNLPAVVAAHAAGNILAALQWTPRLQRVRQRAGGSPHIFLG